MNAFSYSLVNKTKYNYLIYIYIYIMEPARALYDWLDFRDLSYIYSLQLTAYVIIRTKTRKRYKFRYSIYRHKYACPNQESKSHDTIIHTFLFK